MIVGSPTKLNLIPSGIMPVVYISQGDAGYDKEFLIYNGDSPYNVPEGVSATIRGKKADGYGVTEAAALTEGSNLVTVTITEQMVAAAGANLYELVFVDTDGLRIATINMIWAVKADALGDAVISDSDLNYVNEALDKIQNAEAMKNQLDTNTADIAAETAARIAADNTLQSNITTEAATRLLQDNSLQAQINQLIAPTGTAPSAAEVENARIGADGITYPTLGDAIRKQVESLDAYISVYPNAVFRDGAGLTYSGISNSWKLLNTGSCAADELYQMLKYEVTAGDLLHLKLSKDGECVYQFQSSASVPTGVNNNVIGTPVTAETDNVVRVPAGATFLIISQYKTNTSNSVTYAIPRAVDLETIGDNMSMDSNYQEVRTFKELGIEFENYGIESDGSLTPNASRLTTANKIDTNGFSGINLVIPTGYRAYLYVYDSESSIVPKFSQGWYGEGTKIFSLMFPYIRLVLSKTSGSISPSDAENYTIEFTKELTDYSEKEMSLMLEKYVSKGMIRYSFGDVLSDPDSIYTYLPYQSGTIETSSVFISPIIRCVAGDSIEVVSTQEGTKPILATFGNNGILQHYENGIDTLTPRRIKYTFTNNDKYFRVSSRSAQLRYLYIKYTSKFNNNRYVPEYAKAEADSVLQQLQNKLTLGNPVVFGFNTDQHTSYYYKETSVIYGLRTMKMLSKEYPFDFICLGGDAPSYRSNQVIDILNDVDYVNNQLVGAACPVISLVGNHDATDNNQDVTNAELYNVTFKRALTAKLFDYCEYTGCNAYIDSRMHSIRYIFVDSIPRTGYTIADVNVFLDTALSTLPTGYNALIISHRKLNINLSTDLGADGINCGDVLETYASKIIACINGHSHKDASETLNGILYICTTTSGLDGLAAGDTRTESLGTANETAYDVFLIDQTNLKIYAVRYGYGSNREWTYTLA